VRAVLAAIHGVIVLNGQGLYRRAAPLPSHGVTAGKGEGERGWRGVCAAPYRNSPQIKWALARTLSASFSPASLRPRLSFGITVRRAALGS